MPARAETARLHPAGSPPLGLPAAALRLGRRPGSPRLLLLLGAASIASLAPILTFAACALENMAPAPAAALIEAGAYLL